MRSPAHILEVENNADVRDALSLLLIDMGFSVTSAGSGNEALHFLYSEDGCDAVVTDVLMPGMSGIELAERVPLRGLDCQSCCSQANLMD
jgi:CheY-like chemotaxis protein